MTTPTWEAHTSGLVMVTVDSDCSWRWVHPSTVGKGSADARHFGALLFSSAHGIAELEIRGHLTGERWTTSEEIIATLVLLVADHHPAKRTN